MDKKFEQNNTLLPTYLYLYLTKNKNLLIKNVQNRFLTEINKKEIYKNDLYIITIAEIFNYSNSSYYQ
jgi:hypothetical protein